MGMEVEGADCRKQIGLLCTAAARGSWQGWHSHSPRRIAGQRHERQIQIR
jgi:hypothetical protein